MVDTRKQWPVLLSTLLDSGSLAADETAWAMDRIMSAEATPAQIAGFAVALRAKGETVPEVAGLTRAMLDHATGISVEGTSADLVGSGGDRAHTVNISTMGAIVAAGAGLRMVKHGNRAASSSCGSADLLEQLGVVIDLDPSATAYLAGEVGITFCFAPLFHPALRHAAGPRRELGVATVFNFLGPLTNPARPLAQAVGVADRRMCAVLAGVLAERETSALVFRGDDGLDELTTTNPSTVWVVRGGTVVETGLDAADLGIPRAAPEDLRGGDAAYNAAVTRAVLAGQPGAVREAVLLNAATALVAAEGISQPPFGDARETREALTASMHAAVDRCRRAVDGGAAQQVLDRWIAASQGQRAAEPGT